MTPSKYQQAIYDWVKTAGNASVNAVAGSGKTTTLVNLSGQIGRKATFCAFNKHIADELDGRLPHYVKARTIHSMGYAAIAKTLGSPTMDSKKYHNLCKNAGRNWKTWNPRLSLTAHDAAKVIQQLVQMIVATRIKPDDTLAIGNMCVMYDISIDPLFPRGELYLLAKEVLEQGVKQVEESKIIDFLDMLNYPLLRELPFWQNEWLMVDEAQDLSTAQLEIVKRALQVGGRIVACGDPYQSVYGFSGADPWSFQRIGEAFQTVELPLSVCYRCPKAIVRMAQQLVPQIEAADFAEEGNVRTAKSVLDAGPGDLVVCRINAPLFAEYGQLLKAARPAYIVGQKDALSSMIALIERVEKRKDYGTWGTFPDTLKAHKAEVQEQLEKSGEDASHILRERDRCEVIENCLEIFPNCRNGQDFKGELTRIFKPSPASVRLSTIHRAKGLESDNVFVLAPDRVRVGWQGQKPWQAYQEQCCEYVMLTRAKKSLNFIGPYHVGPKVQLGAQQNVQDEQRSRGIPGVAGTADDPGGNDPFFE